MGIRVCRLLRQYNAVTAGWKMSHVECILEIGRAYKYLSYVIKEDTTTHIYAEREKTLQWMLKK
jgi:hypothetical protein